MQRPQRQVLELGLHVRHAEPVRQRRVNVERLLRDLPPLVRRQEVQRAHVVEAVGELDHDDAQVARHRDQHLAEVLRLAFFARGERELTELGDAIHELGDLLAELLLELGLRRVRVLQDVVEEAGRHRGDVHLEVDEEVGDLERVREIRLAGGPLLALVGDLREPIGAVEHIQVGARLVLRNCLYQGLELGHVAIASA